MQKNIVTLQSKTRKMFSLHLVLWDIWQNCIINQILWACAHRLEIFLGDKTHFQAKKDFVSKTRRIFK